jgi:hypothetical protein
MGERFVDFPAVTIGGIDVPVPISITGGEYAIDGGVFTAAAGTIESGQSIAVRVVASGVTYMPVTATVTVGGVDVNFTATTLPDTWAWMRRPAPGWSSPASAYQTSTTGSPIP